jgi:RIO kinase 1
VVGVLTSGKEATVYRCRAGAAFEGRLVAAKVYRSAARRDFRNDAVYRAGRFGRVTRVTRAMARKSRAGRQFAAATWLGHEYATLRALHAAGADVPRPLVAAEGALLLEYFGDEAAAAPTLNKVRLGSTEAPQLFESLLRNVELRLSYNVVHADLSAYNVLYWRGRLVVIDFPQAVDPPFNRQALPLLTRDLANVCRYFARQGVAADPAAHAARNRENSHRHLSFCGGAVRLLCRTGRGSSEYAEGEPREVHAPAVQ